MNKQTPERALHELRRHVDAEIGSARTREGLKSGEYSKNATFVFMSWPTFAKLNLAASGLTCILGDPKKIGAYETEAHIRGFRYWGFVSIDEELPLGKVQIKRCPK